MVFQIHTECFKVRNGSQKKKQVSQEIRRDRTRRSPTPCKCNVTKTGLCLCLCEVVSRRPRMTFRVYRDEQCRFRASQYWFDQQRARGFSKQSTKGRLADRHSSSSQKQRAVRLATSLVNKTGWRREVGGKGQSVRIEVPVFARYVFGMEGRRPVSARLTTQAADLGSNDAADWAGTLTMTERAEGQAWKPGVLLDEFPTEVLLHCGSGR